VTSLTRAGDVIDALITELTAAGFVVLDGNDHARGDVYGTYVVVGGDASDPSPTAAAARPAANTTGVASVFGGAVDEDGVVTMAVVADSGDEDLAGRRAAAATALAAVATALADTTLGGLVATSRIDSAQLFTSRQRGAQARYVFGYRYTAYLT
jgi:hypothetical protein